VGLSHVVAVFGTALLLAVAGLAIPEFGDRTLHTVADKLHMYRVDRR
jgi:hypothetical protein